MDFYNKKKNVLRVLDESGLGKAFQITLEEKDSIVLQSEQNMCNGNCLISLSISDSMFTPIFFCLGKLINESKKDEMLKLLNDFNINNTILKFFLDLNDAIMVQTVCIGSDFNANEYVDLIGFAFQIIQDNYYSEIMKVMWS